jgi:hypothetical protein
LKRKKKSRQEKDETKTKAFKVKTRKVKIMSKEDRRLDKGKARFCPEKNKNKTR